MDISSIGSKIGYQGLVSVKDIATMLAARPSMAELSAKALATTQREPAVSPEDATKAGAATADGKVDMYM